MVRSQIAALFAAEQARLRRLIDRIVGHRPAAEDLVQDTFVNLMRLPATAQIDHAPAYLVRTATHLAIDHLRRERTRGRHVVDGIVIEDERCPAPLPDAIVQGREELAVLRATIADLPEKCRIVFLLSREHGLTMAEIARRLDISPKTVEKHIMRAMVDCRRRLREIGRDV